MTAARVIRTATPCDIRGCPLTADVQITAPADPDCPPRRRCTDDMRAAMVSLWWALGEAGLDPAVLVRPIGQEG